MMKRAKLQWTGKKRPLHWKGLLVREGEKFSLPAEELEALKAMIRDLWKDNPDKFLKEVK